MTYNEFCEYFYNVYCDIPLSAQVSELNRTIFSLKMELAKVKKQVNKLSHKED